MASSRCMNKAFTLLPITLLFVSLPLFPQTVDKFTLRGVIQDQNSVVVPALRLLVNGETKTRTDINGEFRIDLPIGEYVLTSSEIAAEKFRVFIKITDTGLNPGYLELVVDSEAIICSGNRSIPSPKVITSAEPTYPPAARAVRAGGEVSVIVKIKQDGKVSSAKAVSGHPLLRRASELAAEKFLFESDDGNTEREVVITFVFFPEQEEKPGLKKHQCPYRIVVFSKVVEVLNTTGN